MIVLSLLMEHKLQCIIFLKSDLEKNVEFETTSTAQFHLKDSF